MPDDNTAAAPVVSFDDEPLIVVDSEDNVLDYRPKTDCHAGAGILHRAFSIFLFNGDGRVLLQQRSDQKQLWPGYWSNSCCSHPRRGERVADAAARRLREEIDIATPLSFLYRFEYRAEFGRVGTEHELCSVYVARSDDPVAVNANEIAQWAFVAPDALDRDLAARPEAYTPWLKLEWPRIRADHWAWVETTRGRQ